MSKKLESILKNTPSATVTSELSQNSPNTSTLHETKNEITRIVARIPVTLKDEIRNYIRNHKGETETTVILKSLKKFGFNVDNSLIVDKRTLR